MKSVFILLLLCLGCSIQKTTNTENVLETFKIEKIIANQNWIADRVAYFYLELATITERYPKYRIFLGTLENNVGLCVKITEEKYDLVFDTKIFSSLERKYLEVVIAHEVAHMFDNSNDGEHSGMWRDLLLELNIPSNISLELTPEMFWIYNYDNFD